MNTCPYCSKIAVGFLEKIKFIYDDDLKCNECGGNLSLLIGGNLYFRMLILILGLIIFVGYIVLKNIVFIPLLIILGLFCILIIHYFIPLRISDKRI